MWKLVKLAQSEHRLCVGMAFPPLGGNLANLALPFGNDITQLGNFFAETDHLRPAGQVGHFLFSCRLQTICSPHSQDWVLREFVYMRLSGCVSSIGSIIVKTIVAASQLEALQILWQIQED